MIKKLLTVLTSAILVGVLATPALAADEAKVELKTKKTAAVLEGDTAWVAINWKGKNADATDFRIVASADTRGVTISYPDNTATYSSLMDDDTLSAGEIDFTSLKVSVPYGVKKVKIKIKATWFTNGEKEDKDYKVTIPVAKFRGDDIAQATTDAGSISTGSPAWLGVEWTGVAPTLDNVEMTVAGPAGAVITYPADRSFTSLNYDSTLEDGETDIARFLVDASAMAPGSYTFDLVLSYTKGGANKSVTGQVSFQVTG
jgi:hypothetical protein